MSQVKAEGGRKGAAGTARPRPIVRPLSPHLQVWRWHVTMLGSILHRASGVALHLGAAVVVAWVAALAAGPETYDLFLRYMKTPVGLLVWFGLSAALFYHLAAGLRHLAWDTGALFRPRTADFVTNLSIVFAAVATAALWVWLLFTGRVGL